MRMGRAEGPLTNKVPENLGKVLGFTSGKHSRSFLKIHVTH